MPPQNDNCPMSLICVTHMSNLPQLPVQSHSHSCFSFKYGPLALIILNQ